jgi:hypothetical protein
MELLVATALVAAACDKTGDGGSEREAPPKDKTAAPVPTSVESAVERAKAVASAAAKDIQAAEGAGTCERAYVELEGFIESMKAIPGNQASPTVPERTGFLKACSELPASLQRCLLLSELMKEPARGEQCRKDLEALPPETKAKAKALMDAASAKGK